MNHGIGDGRCNFSSWIIFLLSVFGVEGEIWRVAIGIHHALPFSSLPSYEMFF